MNYIILAQSEVTANALEAWLMLLEETNSARIVINTSRQERGGNIDIYRNSVKKIGAALAQTPYVAYDENIVLVDSVHPSSMSAISEQMGWDHLVALLILTFPDVKWIFGALAGDINGFPKEDHQVSSLLIKAWRDPLLDPTGLREWVREKTNEAIEKLTNSSGSMQKRTLKLPRRGNKNLAAAIDDEVDYATMNAYTAFRYGYRSDIITTWSLMAERFGKMPGKDGVSHGYQLLFEDMRLSFPDKPGHVHLSRLNSDNRDIGEPPGRAHHCPSLHNKNDSSTWRFLITTGQMGEDDELVDANRKYLCARPGYSGRLIFKNLGGLCDLWTVSGLRDAAEHAQSPRGNASGFLWPPERVTEGAYDGHGAPGKLEMVARTLIQRAAIFHQNSIGASEWIRTAVLASDAAELLNGKTPGMTIQALTLKHECEVRAECTFIGAGFHFGLAERIKEIKSEIKNVCNWYHENNRTQVICDANAAIINRLMLVFRDAGKIEEQEACLVELRRLNRQMTRPKGWWTHVLILPWLAHFVLKYGEWLLGGFSRLLGMTLLWIGSITGLTHLLIGAVDGSFYTTVSMVIGWFFGGNGASDPPMQPPYEFSVHLLSWVAVSVGVFHLGILISFLYSLISRR